MPRHLVMWFAPLLALVATTCWSADQTVGSAPLVATVSDTLGQKVTRLEGPSGAQSADTQYFSSYYTYLALSASASPAIVYSGDASGSTTPFTVVSNAVTPGPSATRSITTVVGAGDAVTVTHTLTYTDGSEVLHHQWRVFNGGSTRYTNMFLRYGGDTFFHGNDQAVGFENTSSGLLYCTNPSVPGFMGMISTSGPASSFTEGDYATVWAALENPAPGLSNTVVSSLIDNGMGLEWSGGGTGFAPNATVTFSADEVWDDPNAITITAPPEQKAPIGTVPLTFAVVNHQATTDTFSFTAMGTTGLTIPGGNPANVQIAAGSSAQITLQVQVAGTAAPQGTVSLTATSVTTPTLQSQAATLIDVAVVAVASGQSKSALIGSSVSLPFQITNLEPTTDAFSVSVSASAGTTITGVAGPLLATVRTSGGPATRSATVLPVTTTAGNVNIAAGATVTVTVTATVTGPVGTTVLISLTSASVSNVPAAQPAVGTYAITLTSGATAPVSTVAAATIPRSTPGHTVFIPLGPGTPEGIANVLHVIADAGRDAVGYSWDATTQTYVELPGLPTGGLDATSGIFVASAIDLSFNLTGTASEPPATLTLQPGWNLVGVPPIDAGGGTILTAHPFPGAFTLFDSGGLPVTSLQTFTDTLGTVGSGDVTTANPYLFNGTRYSRVSTLQTGVAYWMKNNSTGAVRLRLSVSGATLSALTQAHSVGTTYRSQGAPPAFPSSTSSSASGGHGCGAAAGMALIGMCGVLWWRRRP